MRGLVFGRRPFQAIDHQHFDRHLLLCELQAELRLDRFDERGLKLVDGIGRGGYARILKNAPGMFAAAIGDDLGFVEAGFQHGRASARNRGMTGPGKKDAVGSLPGSVFAASVARWRTHTYRYRGIRRSGSGAKVGIALAAYQD
jgi:hypothetical protein